MPEELESVNLTVIGKIRNEHTEISNMPIQSAAAAQQEGVAEIYPRYAQGLLDVEGFSHLTLLYYFLRQNGYQLKVIPFMDDVEHGVFATRSPRRPASIGMSIVRLLKVEDNKIYFECADMLDGTPLIDIKPFFKAFDNRSDAISGWLEDKDEKQMNYLPAS